MSAENPNPVSAKKPVPESNPTATHGEDDEEDKPVVMAWSCVGSEDRFLVVDEDLRLPVEADAVC